MLRREQISATTWLAAMVSLERRPSMENTKGVKCRRASKQESRYLDFLAFAWRSRTLVGSWLRNERASVSETRISNIAVVPRVQNPWAATYRLGFLGGAPALDTLYYFPSPTLGDDWFVGDSRS
jgi:hypothetical protein